MNLILFGFKGCGKTHFGKKLADKMQRPFLDTDEILSELYAQKMGRRLRAREIYQEAGEVLFRSLEREALLTLENVQHSIIALGGGAVLDPDNVEFLQKVGTLVYLKASPETLKRRMLRDELPAFLERENPTASFLQMIHDRTPLYESIPARRIDVDLLDEAGVLAALRSILILEEPSNGF